MSSCQPCQDVNMDTCPQVIMSPCHYGHHNCVMEWLHIGQIPSGPSHGHGHGHGQKSKLLAFKRDKWISIKPISEAVKESQIYRSIKQILYMFYWKYSTQWQRDNHLDDLNMLLIHRAWHEVKAHNGSLPKRHKLDPQEHLGPALGNFNLHLNIHVQHVSIPEICHFFTPTHFEA